MSRYETVIGLEVHAELNTDTKIYCGCKNEFGREVNTLVCPICSGMPGTLPTLNRSVVEYCVKMGLALGCSINNVSKQDRKNYFYPDLPKGYQISQFDVPLCENGSLDILVGNETKTIGITRIHIEEDAGKIVRVDGIDGTLADFNRCGVPLIEIVSEPDMRSADEAKAYLETIHAILLYLGISDAKMQEGNVRCDVNVSLNPIGATEFGTRCEMKNVNSFGAVYRGILYEVERQTKMLDAGEVIEQQTRRWDDQKGESVLLRSKENAHDYRYFPEPDLLGFTVPTELINKISSEIPELPVAKAKRYMENYSLPVADAMLLAENRGRAEFFEKAVDGSNNLAKGICNWIIGDIAAYLAKNRVSIDETSLKPKRLRSLVELIDNGTISNTAGKAVLEELLISDVDPVEVAKDKNLIQINDSDALKDIVFAVVEENQKVVEDYKNGKTNALGFFVGQCMKKSKGKGNPKIFTELLTERLKSL